MSFPGRLGVFSILLFLCLSAIGADGRWAGESLNDYIKSLQRHGLRIIYSTDLVLEQYRVLDEPVSDDPEAALREALAPYGLILTNGPAGSLLITRSEEVLPTVTIEVLQANGTTGIANARISIDGAPVGVSDAAGHFSIANLETGSHELLATAEGYAKTSAIRFTVTREGPGSVSVLLEPLPEPLPEIIVTTSLYNIRYEHSGSYNFLDRDLTTKMPDLGDEALRAIARLPGTAGGGLSTRSHVRGGVQNEQLFLLDGLRLYEPYHMKDFHSIATIVDQNVISGIDFYSAGYQARYGDRMSGVVDISLREPPEETETELGLSFFNTSVLSRGRFGGHDRGDWLVSARRGNLDLLADAINPDYGSPRYQDLLARIGWDVGGHTYLTANALVSYDKITVSEIDDSEQANAKYRNDVFWLKAVSTWSDKLEGSTILSATEIENQRAGMTEKPGVISGFVDDARKFRSLALKQDWKYGISDRWLLSSGFELKRLEADYRYNASLNVAPPFDQILDNQLAENRSIDISPRGSQYAAYGALRWRPNDRVTLDAGLRWDQQTYTTAEDDEQVSPRINLLYRAGKSTELRFAFGEYYQAQEINELQVSDGVAHFYPAQHAQHLVASLTHSFDFGVDLRLETYQKKYRSLMPRFENIFDPLVLIPELQIDRARIDAESAVAQGIELTLGGGGSNELSWWTSYSWSRIVDKFQGETTKRSWDQTHTFGAGLSRDWRKWSFSVAGVLHTGWPKTVLLVEEVTNADGSTSLIATTGPRNSRRHSVFQSLDARVSRRFDLPKGDLTAFLEVTNLNNRENSCCTEYSVQLDSEANELVQTKGGSWLPIVPSLGVVWRF
jgi:outer membrane receptor protein involved in Fe transport